MKDIGGLGSQIWEVEAETCRQQSNYPKKVHFIQRLRFVALEGQELRPDAEVGDIQYRIGYYIVSAKGKWWWAQFCLLIPETDLQPLLDQARAEGTLLPAP
jgi:hypothetical protein